MKVKDVKDAGKCYAYQIENQELLNGEPVTTYRTIILEKGKESEQVLKDMWKEIKKNKGAVEPVPETPHKLKGLELD